MKRRELSALSLSSVAAMVSLPSVTARTDTPVIEDVTLETTTRSDGDIDFELTVRAASSTPVNWLERRFLGPEGSIRGGGSTAEFEEVNDNIWEFTETITVSKWAPDGEYVYEDVRVRNEAERAADAWPETVSKTLETGYEADKPVLKDVTLETRKLPDERIEFEVTIVAESNAPVHWRNRSFVGPEGSILGGGSAVPFEEIDDGRWQYVDTEPVSKWAPDGVYAFERISVRNEGMLESDEWPAAVSTTIETDYQAETPVITDVSVAKTTMVDGDTGLELTVEAESTAPVDWLRRRFVGPRGTILGGGRAVSFAETDPGHWTYTDMDTVSEHAPDGTYAYEDIRIENAGMLESEPWPEIESISIGKESEEGCFIATAACGTPDHEHVETLRRFRDESLYGTTLGELFIRTYYALSPPIADWIVKSPRRRRIVRTLLVRPAAWLVSGETVSNSGTAEQR